MNYLASRISNQYCWSMNVYLMSRDLDLETHHKVLRELKKRKLTFKIIAARLGVSPSAVSMVSSGRAVSKRITNELAKALNKTPAEIWPHRYPEIDDDVV